MNRAKANKSSSIRAASKTKARVANTVSRAANRVSKANTVASRDNNRVSRVNKDSTASRISAKALSRNRVRVETRERPASKAARTVIGGPA
jgi:hypothetical protein